ncbi:MAG: NF038122 family metalloprotease, partial [Verrucomicrobia bacterium]|nr:NF038122 family metalloprotease [Verrucomicrobiota bacterium]
NITVGASPLPNLTPFQPAGWSDKVVVSTNTGNNIDSPVLAYTNMLYVDWAITNSGASTANNFVVTLSVDGAVSNYWVITALAAGTYTNFVDYSIGSLAGGGHTVTITCDASNNVTESSEGDNAYTKNISVISPTLPNLAPYQKSGWSDAVVVSTTSGVFTSNHTPTTTNTLYVDWAVINNGVSSAGASTTTLYIDGVATQTWPTGSLPVNSYSYVTDYSIGQLSAGTHKISITADSAGVVPETNEGDNSFTNTITVTQILAPAPTLTAPANGSTGQATAPTFSWSAVSGVTGYRIIVATNAADLPTDPFATNGGPSTVISGTVSSNSYTPVPINPGVTYYWEVHGRYGTSDAGTWSSVFSFTTAVTMSGLVIIPTFDSTITSDPQAITIENTINAAIAVYEADFSDPVTVHITFKKMGSGLGQSSGQFANSYSYSTYRAALVSHSVSTDDTTALTFLPSASVNPVNGNANVSVKLPLARALGFSADPPGGAPDGTVSLNLSLMNYSGAYSDPTKYALFAVASHEIDEVLGMDTAMNGLANGAASPTGAVSPMDLFRYDVSGA